MFEHFYSKKILIFDINVIVLICYGNIVVRKKENLL